VNPAKLAKQLNEAAGFHRNGELGKAERLYRDILKHVPQQPDALHLLGLLLDQRGDRAKGITFIQKALAVKSAFPDAHFNLGRLLNNAGDITGARRHYDMALALKPGHPLAYNGLGIIHRGQRNYAEAAADFQRAIRFDPQLIDAYINLCNTYRDACQEDAIPHVAQQGLAVKPDCADLWLLLGEAAFTAGRLDEGWKNYAWRFTARERPVEAKQYALPIWQGEDLAEKALLIWGEQGVGDEVIFASMIGDVMRRAKRCVLQTTPRLFPLFQRSFPGLEIYAQDVPADIVAALDMQVPMGGLGQGLRPSFGSFPATGGYLKADTQRTAALRAKYKDESPGTVLVGLAWRSANVSDAAEKTIDLDQWIGILNVPGFTFVNLQYGDTAEALASLRAKTQARIISDIEIDPLSDLDAFAAQVAAMDLVISSSNTAAHIAGALDVPSFCIIPRALGSGRRWYWFGGGAYTPWYRSMTVFRQKQTGVWTETLSDVAGALAAISPSVATGMEHHSVQSLRDLAQAHLKAGAPSEALPLITRAIAQDPSSPELHNIHGMILARLGRFDDAAAAYRRTIALAPGVAEVHNNLGTALRRAGLGHEALASYAEAYRLKPEHPSISLNYAMALGEVDRLEDALAALDRLLVAQPDYVDAHYNRALVLLAMGRFEEGWSAFTWRMKRGQVHVRYEDFPQPVWSGEDVTDRHVLVWTDLGIGDEILLASIVPDAAASMKRMTLLCSERLAPLFRRSFPGVTVDVRQAPLPPSALNEDISVQMSMAEVGAAFRHNVDSFPSRRGFLKVDSPLRDLLREKYLTGRGDCRLVGLSWRSINPEIGAQKSLPLAEWLPILKTPGVVFVNLQYGDCRAEIADLRNTHGIEIVDDETISHLGDMDPVAAQVAAMDLVVSISNTTVHVAGGVGVPTWMLLPRGYARLWYWFRNFSRCLWYPSVTLRGSEQEGDWTDLISQCARDLKQWAGRTP
jgi:tetratricopeptide (TPR) repeat protein